MLRNAFEDLATEANQLLILQAVEDLVVAANRDLSVSAYDLSSAPYSTSIIYDVNARLDHLLMNFSTVEPTDITITLNDVVLYSVSGDTSLNVKVNFENLVVIVGDILTIEIGQTQSSSAGCDLNMQLTSVHWVATFASSS